MNILSANQENFVNYFVHFRNMKHWKKEKNPNQEKKKKLKLCKNQSLPNLETIQKREKSALMIISKKQIYQYFKIDIMITIFFY